MQKETRMDFWKGGKQPIGGEDQRIFWKCSVSKGSFFFKSKKAKNQEENLMEGYSACPVSFLRGSGSNKK